MVLTQFSLAKFRNDRMKRIACHVIVAQPKPRLPEENFAAILARKWDIAYSSQPHHDILDVIEVADEMPDPEATELATAFDCIHLGHNSDEDAMSTGEIDGPVENLQPPSRSLFEGILDDDWEEYDCSPAPLEAPSGTCDAMMEACPQDFWTATMFNISKTQHIPFRGLFCLIILSYT